MPTNLLFLVLAVIFVWLVSLSIFFWRVLQHYNRLTKGVSEKSLRAVLESLLKDVDVNKKDIDYLKEYSLKLEKDGLLHIQKVGLIRFNLLKIRWRPKLYFIFGRWERYRSRNFGTLLQVGTRWYAKRVISGKGVDYELSEEEKKSLKEASSDPEV